MAIDVSNSFQQLIEQLRITADANAAAINGTSEQPGWFVPTGWAGDVFDIAGLQTGFDRDTANKNYQDALSGNAMSPAMGAKLEMDIMAVHERAFRLRHATTPRLLAHTAGRLGGHGHAAGIHTGVILQSVVDLYAQGTAK